MRKIKMSKKETKQIRLLKEAIKADSSEVYSAIKLYDIYMDAKAYKEAKDVLEQTIELDSTNAIVFHYLGSVYSKLKNPTKSIEALKKAIKLYKKNAKKYYNKGISKYKQNKFEEAIIELKKHNIVTEFELAALYLISSA